METYVTAEFETADFADLALGRISNIFEDSKARVLRNRISDNFNDDDWTLFFPIIDSFYYTIYYGLAIYSPYFIWEGRRHEFAENYRDQKIEPSWRNDRLLEVLINSDLDVRRVSGILINAGGRNVRTIQK